MKNKKSDLSKTEWLIMNICWKKGKSSARNVFEETLKTKTRSYHTIKTMLDRLVVKGYLTREKFGPIWFYSPIVAKSKATGKEIERFVGTVLDNTFTPLLSFFSEKESLTDEEIDSLEKLIEEKKKGKAK
jgi:BlaI family penicillinase repressor